MILLIINTFQLVFIDGEDEEEDVPDLLVDLHLCVFDVGPALEAPLEAVLAEGAGTRGVG